MNIHDVDRLSLWQFMARVEGFVEAHSPKEDKQFISLGEDEKDNLMRLVEQV